MANSLEVRVPFLDHRLVEFAFSLPESLRVRRYDRKYLLKRAVAPLLPPDFQFDRKQGFSIPLVEWLQGDLGNRYLDALGSSLSKGLIQQEPARRWLLELKKGRLENAKKAWAVMMFLLWLERYLP